MAFSGQDEEIHCRDCKQVFVFTAGEQSFFQERNFTPPTRCKPCRDKNKLRRAEQETPVQNDPPVEFWAPKNQGRGKKGGRRNEY